MVLSSNQFVGLVLGDEERQLCPQSLPHRAELLRSEGVRLRSRGDAPQKGPGSGYGSIHTVSAIGARVKSLVECGRGSLLR